MPKRPPKPIRVPARIVRRTDSLGRSYYIHKETGRRVAKQAWTHDRKRRAAQKDAVEHIIARRRERKRQDQAREEFLRKRPPLAPLSKETLDVGRSPRKPFPPGVTGTGVPEGMYEDDIPWFTVPDEDEYEEGTGR